MTDYRKQLSQALDWDSAHQKFDDAVRDFPRELRGVRPANGPHSPWELLEHLRIAQWDILEFTRDANHASPEFPAGYWPAGAAPPSDDAWDESIERYRSDLRALMDITNDDSIDLLKPLAHGDGQTPLREILLALDHNAYHLGQLMLVRRQLGA